MGAATREIRWSNNLTIAATPLRRINPRHDKIVPPAILRKSRRIANDRDAEPPGLNHASKTIAARAGMRFADLRLIMLAPHIDRKTPRTATG